MPSMTMVDVKFRPPGAGRSILSEAIVLGHAENVEIRVEEHRPRARALTLVLGRIFMSHKQAHDLGHALLAFSNHVEGS